MKFTVIKTSKKEELIIKSNDKLNLEFRGFNSKLILNNNKSI